MVLNQKIDVRKNEILLKRVKNETILFLFNRYYFGNLTMILNKILNKNMIVLAFASLFFFVSPHVFAIDNITVNPVSTTDLLVNPGKGWMTMFKPAIYDSKLPDEIPSALYYVRIYWRQVHTGPGQYDWSDIDSAIANARRGGQQVMIRLMPFWRTASIPEWIANISPINCTNFPGIMLPDLDNSVVQGHIEDLLREMGARYDRHPDVHSIEINFYGWSGEGHFYNCGDNLGIPSHAAQRWLANKHYEYFPSLPIIGPVHAQETNQQLTIHMYDAYGDTRGAGVFLDCWGDSSHQNSKYPSWLNIISKRGDNNWDAWEKGIIKLEPCNLPASDIPASTQWALDYHASFIGNKNHSFPDAYLGDIINKLKRLGYRLVLRELTHPADASQRGTISVRMDIDNIGVAPPYRDYYLAIRLKSLSNEHIYTSDRSVKHWLPGSHTETLSFTVPYVLENGIYELAVAIVDEFNHEPAIMMPIEGLNKTDKWHTVSQININSSSGDPNDFAPPTGLRVIAQ